MKKILFFLLFSFLFSFILISANQFAYNYLPKVEYLNVTDKVDIISFTYTDSKLSKPVYKVSNKGIVNVDVKPIDDEIIKEK